MGKHIASFLRGVGSVLSIAPDPQRETIRPLYQHRGESAEDALYRTWSRVGDSLIAASGMKQIGRSKRRSTVVQKNSRKIARQNAR